MAGLGALVRGGTQANAAGAEEIAAASEALSARSQEPRGAADGLMRMVDGGHAA